MEWSSVVRNGKTKPVQTSDWVLKYSVNCYIGHMDILYTKKIAWDGSIWKHNTNKRNQCSALFLLRTWGLTCCGLTQTRLPLAAGYRREFNRKLSMCRWFIDGHQWEWLSPSEVKTTLDYQQTLDSHQFIQQYLIFWPRLSQAEPRKSWKRIICIIENKRNLFF